MFVSINLHKGVYCRVLRCFFEHLGWFKIGATLFTSKITNSTTLKPVVFLPFPFLAPLCQLIPFLFYIISSFFLLLLLSHLLTFIFSLFFSSLHSIFSHHCSYLFTSPLTFHFNALFFAFFRPLFPFFYFFCLFHFSPHPFAIPSRV